MFKTFENLINPFKRVPSETPPDTYWAYVKTQLAPFRKWLPYMAILGIIVALTESGIIFYSGRVIDLMNTSGADNIWAEHGIELLIAAIFILVFVRIKTNKYKFTPVCHKYVVISSLFICL